MEELNRTFIGIRLSQDVQSKLGETQLTLRHKAGSDVLRFNPPATIQIVIIPLGELLVGTFDQVRRTLPNLVSQLRPFQLAVEGLGGTPSNLQPRFVWAGLTGDINQLVALHNTLENGLRPMLPNDQPKPFVPHIDIARIKIESEQNRTTVGRALRMLQIGCLANLNVSQIELFRSTTSAAGPELVSEGTFALGAY